MRDDFTDEESDRFERPLPPRAMRPRLIVVRSSAPPPKLPLPRAAGIADGPAFAAVVIGVMVVGLVGVAIAMGWVR